MYPISNGYKNVIYSGDARHKLKLLFNGVEYQSANSKVESVKRTSKILSDGGERFSLDNFKAQELEIVINDIDLEDIIEPVSVSIGTLVNNAYEYVPIGIFNLNEKPQTNSGKTTIKLIDNAVKFDVPYNAQDVIEENGGEASLLQILQDICTKCEVTLSTTDFVNKDTKVSVWDNSINARQYVMYIAEIAGRIATINRSGELELIDLQKGSDVEVEINNPTEINNVLPRPINDLQLKGNTEQTTYTGKNLLDCSYTQTSNGIVTTYNSNGTLSFSGTPTSTWANITRRASMNLPAGTYTLSIQEPISTGFVVRLYHDNSNYTDIGFGAGTKKVTRTLNSAVVSGYIYLHTMTVGQAVNVNGIKAQLESGSNATNWEKFVGGTASPNPDYPQSIENVTGLQTIEVEGKNLLPYPYTDTTKTVNGITFTDLGDGTIKVNGTATANASFRLLGSSSQQYTINGNYIYGGLTANIRVQIVHYNPGYTVLGNSTGSSTQINKNTYTTGYIEIVVQNGQVVNNQIIKPMLTLTQDNIYEEYKGQKYNINLPVENLFDIKNTAIVENYLEQSGVSLTFNVDGTITANGTNTGKYKYIRYDVTLPAGTYYFSGCPQGGSLNGYSTIASNQTTPDYGTGGLFTLAETTTVKFYPIRIGSETVTFNNAIFKPMIAKVQVAYNDYEPYGTTPIELCKIGDYQDRIYKQNNKWYIEKKIGKYVFTGTESSSSFEKLNSVMSGTTRFIYNMNGIYQTNTSKVVISNCFKSATFDEIYSGNTTDKNLISSFVNTSRFVMRIDNTIANSIDEFKTYLSNNPVEVYYVLATPEITEITNTDLIEQLNSIELLKGYNYVSIYSDNLVGGLSINYQSERQPIELDSWLFEKYTVGDKLKISRVVYEDAIRKFEHGDDSEGTLYINSANPYIINQGEIDNTYSIINDLEMYSMNITKMIGNPAIDPWDMLEFEYNDNKYQFLGQNTLNYRGTIIQSFNTQIGSNAKSQENVTINAEDSKFKRIFTRIDQAEGNIELNTSQITNVQGDLEQNYYTKEQANILIQNAETGVTNTFSEAGGNNIFRNTGLWFADDKVTEYIYPSSTTYPSSDLYPLSQQHYEFWDGYVEKIKNDNSSNLSSMLLKSGYVQQKQTVPNGNYTVSFKYKKLINVATCKVFINGVEYPLTQTTDTEFVTGYKDTEGHYVTQPLEVSNREIMVKFYTDADNACEIYDLMVNAGTVKLAYSQNQNETKTDTVNISKGITITSTDTDTIFKANADGIRTLNQNNNVLTEFTDTGMKTKKMEVNEEAQICGTLIKEVANQTWFTKL